MATQLWSVALIVASTLLSSLAAFSMKRASAGFGLRFIKLAGNLPLMGALSLYFISAVIGVIAYRGGDLTVLVPLASLNYVCASLLAVRFLHETMNPWKIAGIVLIMLGITAIGMGGAL